MPVHRKRLPDSFVQRFLINIKSHKSCEAQRTGRQFCRKLAGSRHYCLGWSALDSIHQNHLGREGLRWNDGKKLRSYDNMPTYPDDPSVLFVWEIASKLFTKEMVSINLLFDCSIIKHFTQFYADISRI